MAEFRLENAHIAFGKLDGARIAVAAGIGLFYGVSAMSAVDLLLEDQLQRFAYERVQVSFPQAVVSKTGSPFAD